MLLSEASRLYAVSRRLELHEHVISPPLIQALERAVRDLREASREAEEDPVWGAFWVPALRYRRDAYATGLPLNRAELLTRADEDRFTHAGSQVATLYPQHSRKITALQRAFEACRASPASPIADQLLELLRMDALAQVGLFTDNEELRHASEVYLRERVGRDDLRVLRSGQLHKACIGGSLIVVGPLERFPASLTIAPRASSLHVLRYEWSNSTRCDAKLLPDALGSPVHVHEMTAPVPKRSLTAMGDPSVVMDPRRLQLVLSRFVDAAERDEGEQTGNASDLVKVRLVRLAAGKCIFLESGSRVRVLEIPREVGGLLPPDAVGAATDAGAPLDSVCDSNLGLASHLVAVDGLIPGLFLVERQGGGGASIDLIARRLQGRERKGLEQIQAQWKRRLTNAIQNRGLRSIAEVFSDRFPTAHANLRNWAGDAVFLPEDPECFRALMEFLGFGKDVQLFWDVGRALQSMNRDAGRAISARLLRELAEHVSPAALANKGSIGLELKGFESTGLLVSRIEGVSSAELDIPRGKVRRLFDGDLLDMSLDA
ncbi:hypothetical protein HI113_07240 [Corallococcus exiguus]|uniref:hypothetical protein n=1 Tax=Corallococcus exiguus TaxID=83462 RepID=UPI0014742A0D|nr:hypothetical protein [Corallococcus exiguus]NNB93702.1 hypothetical protein [Corallococcus exiguus]